MKPKIVHGMFSSVSDAELMAATFNAEFEAIENNADNDSKQKPTENDNLSPS